MFAKVCSFVHKLIDDNILNLSAQLAYYMLMSFFPFLILIVSIVGIFFSNNADILVYIVDLLPATIGSLILDNAQNIYSAKSTALLSASFLVTLWLSLRGIKTMMGALDLVYSIDDPRSYIRFNLHALLNLLIIAITICSCFGIVIWLGLDIFFIRQSNLLLLLRGFSVFFLLFVGMVFLNSFMPARKIHIKYTVLGSLFSAIVLIISSFVFGYYATNIWQYNRIYGTIGTVVVFLVWLFMSAMIVLLGSEINAFLYDRRIGMPAEGYVWSDFGKNKKKD